MAIISVAVTLIATWVKDDQIKVADIKTKSVLPGVCQKHVVRCPEHVCLLLEQTWQICETNEQFARIAGLLMAYADVFSHGDDVGRTDVEKHSIPRTDGTRPIRQLPGVLEQWRTRRGNARWQIWYREAWTLEPTDGPLSLLVVLVHKKDHSWRLCVDYRRLNAVTRKDAYPCFSWMDNSFDALSGTVFFSTLNLVSGYWQVPLV